MLRSSRQSRAPQPISRAESPLLLSRQPHRLKSAQSIGVTTTSRLLPPQGTKVRSLSAATSSPSHVHKSTRHTRMHSTVAGQSSSSAPPVPTFAPNDTLFILCDIQENFRKVIPHEKFGNGIVKASALLLSASNTLNIPLIISEQNPFLGTVDELQSLVQHRIQPAGESDHSVKSTDDSGAATTPASVYSFRKTRFSLINETVNQIINDVQPKKVVLFGLETHVCIMQTALDLLNGSKAKLYTSPFELHLALDAIVSQNVRDSEAALARLQQAGAIPTSAEAVLYEIMADAKHPRFKEVLHHVKVRNGYYDKKAEQH